jgi:hypothetical protein
MCVGRRNDRRAIAWLPPSTWPHFEPSRRRMVKAPVSRQTGTRSGQFEYFERATAKMKVVAPFTLLIIFVLLFLTFRKADEARRTHGRRDDHRTPALDAGDPGRVCFRYAGGPFGDLSSRQVRSRSAVITTKPRRRETLIMTPPVRKFALAAHVTTSVGWVGALAVFLAHAIASLTSRDDQIVRAASLAMGLAAWFVILPLSLASLTTGLVQALGSTWGLVRHYWVLFKLVLTAVATIVLLLKMGPISDLAEATIQTSLAGTDLIVLRTSLVVHAAGGLVVLLAAVALAIYKPPGMTPYGIDKQREAGNAVVTPGRVPLPTTTPRWVKVVGAIAVFLVLVIGAMVLGGGHGPRVH